MCHIPSQGKVAGGSMRDDSETVRDPCHVAVTALEKCGRHARCERERAERRLLSRSGDKQVERRERGRSVRSCACVHGRAVSVLWETTRAERAHADKRSGGRSQASEHRLARLRAACLLHGAAVVAQPPCRVYGLGRLRCRGWKYLSLCDPCHSGAWAKMMCNTAQNFLWAALTMSICECR